MPSSSVFAIHLRKDWTYIDGRDSIFPPGRPTILMPSDGTVEKALVESMMMVNEMARRSGKDDIVEINRLTACMCSAV